MQQQQTVLKESKAKGLYAYSLLMGLLYLFMLAMQIAVLFGVEFIGFAPVDLSDVEASLDNIVNGAVILLVYVVLGAIFMAGFQKSKKRSVDGLGFVAGGILLTMIVGGILVLTTMLSMVDFETLEVLVNLGNAAEFFRWEFIALVLAILGLVIIKNRNHYIS